MMPDRPESCTRCAEGGTQRYCARLRCYCNHATCWAHHYYQHPKPRLNVVRHD